MAKSFEHPAVDDREPLERYRDFLLEKVAEHLKAADDLQAQVDRIEATLAIGKTDQDAQAEPISADDERFVKGTE